MRHNGFLIFVTITLLIATVGVVVVFGMFDGDWEKAVAHKFIPPRSKVQTEPGSEVEAGADVPPLTPPAEDVESPNELQLPPVLGSLSTSPARNVEPLPLSTDLPRLREIPWSKEALANAYRLAAGRSCRLQPPGSSVTPTPNAKGLSRLTACIVGLEIEPSARRALPKLSKSTIESYLADHLLAIQPTVQSDPVHGNYFQGQLQAAFFAKNSPTQTLEAEPMIGQAVSQFRVLGFFTDPNNPEEARYPRTMVLTFAYKRDDPSHPLPVDEYELIFLHLYPGAGDPRLTVFGTSDGLQSLQALVMPDLRLGRTAPTVQAQIRFGDFKMMGLYPADPIVSAVRNTYRASLPVSEVQLLLRGTTDRPAQTLAELLESLPDTQAAAR
ncbi:hypothetical protein [Planctomicrobium sp. SH664]|uniref:hypothetical protein n=1 Tax=Planctomicrobium sp. SH664 TaxID=3448125 RepID=UPI003F5B95E3